MSYPNLALTGGTGFLGKKLRERLEAPLVLTRSPERHAQASQDATRFAEWNSDLILPPDVLKGIQAVVHLAGEPIAEGRWNAERKQRIRDSRVIGTRCLIKSLARMSQRPSVLISASAVGFYGNRPGETLTESSDPGQGFLCDVCEEWEAEALEAENLGIRVCLIRLGIVLDPESGAMEKMLPFFKLGIAGPLGTGRQYFPWIHVDDVVGLILHCLDRPNVSGPVNAVAPETVTNWQFTRQLGKTLHRPTLLPVPKFGLKTLYGEFAESLFDDQKVQPVVAKETGYDFRYPDLKMALNHLLQK